LDEGAGATHPSVEHRSYSLEFYTTP